MSEEIIKLSFATLVKKLDNDYHAQPRHLLALDPGGTTGWAHFVGTELAVSGQVDTSDLREGILNVLDLFDYFPDNPHERSCGIVMEDYRVYGWKTEQHTWSELHTPKLIGGITALATIYQLPLYMQMAQQAKGFCTDEKLEEWGMYKKGERHARDAIRHGCYLRMFHKADDKPAQKGH